MTNAPMPAFVVGVLVLIVIVSAVRRKRRSQALEAVAAEMGFSLVAKKPNFLADLQLPTTLLPGGWMNAPRVKTCRGALKYVRLLATPILYEAGPLGLSS